MRADLIERLKSGLDALRARASRGDITSADVFTLTNPLMDLIARQPTDALASQEPVAIPFKKRPTAFIVRYPVGDYDLIKTETVAAHVAHLHGVDYTGLYERSEVAPTPDTGKENGR